MKAARAVEVLKDTVKMRAIPAEAPKPSSRLKALVQWFEINREPLGKIVLAASILMRGLLFIPHHTDIANYLKGLDDLFVVAGGMTYAAGRFKSDKGKLQDIHTEIKRRSGQIPAFDRRTEHEG
jgi:hypothetical protein